MAAPSSPADDIYAAADALAADSASAAAYAAVLRCAGGQQDIRLRILALPLLAQHAARQPAAAQTQAAAALAAAAGGAQDQGQADRRGPAQRQLAGVAAAAIARYAGTDGAAPLADALATALVARSGLPDALRKALVHASPEAAFTTAMAGLDTEDEGARAAAFAHLIALLRVAEIATAPTHVQQAFAERALPLLDDTSQEEFAALVPILREMTLHQSAEGSKTLAEKLFETSEGRDLDIADADGVARFLDCLQQAVPCLTRGTAAEEFLTSISTRLLPNLSALEPASALRAVQLLAELTLTQFTREQAQTLYPHLQPAVVAQLHVPAAGDAIPPYNFSLIEALLVAYLECAHVHHDLVLQTPGLLQTEPHSAVINELNRLESACKPYALALQKAVRTAPRDQPEGQLQHQALRVLNNILSLKRSLQGRPFARAHTFAPSWRPAPSATANAKRIVSDAVPTTAMRHTDATAATNGVAQGKRPRIQGVYQPPTGKYSRGMVVPPELQPAQQPSAPPLAKFHDRLAPSEQTREAVSVAASSYEEPPVVISPTTAVVLAGGAVRARMHQQQQYSAQRIVRGGGGALVRGRGGRSQGRGRGRGRGRGGSVERIVTL